MSYDGKIVCTWLVLVALACGFIWGRATTPEYVARQEARERAFEERLREPDPDWMRDIMTPRDLVCDEIIENVRDLLDDEYMQEGRSLNR